MVAGIPVGRAVAIGNLRAHERAFAAGKAPHRLVGPGRRRRGSCRSGRRRWRGVVGPCRKVGGGSTITARGQRSSGSSSHRATSARLAPKHDSSHSRPPRSARLAAGATGTGGASCQRANSPLKKSGQSWLGLEQDVNYRAAIVAREPVVRRGLLLPRQHPPHPFIHGVLGEPRHLLERVGVDQITARIPHQPMLEIELPQRSAALVARPARSRTSARIATSR